MHIYNSEIIPRQINRCIFIHLRHILHLKSLHALGYLSVVFVEVNNLSLDLPGRWIIRQMAYLHGLWKSEIHEAMHLHLVPAQRMRRNQSYVQLCRLPILPAAYFTAASFHGLVSGNFKLNAILSPLISLIKTLIFSPALKTFFGLSTLPPAHLGNMK